MGPASPRSVSIATITATCFKGPAVAATTTNYPPPIVNHEGKVTDNVEWDEELFGADVEVEAEGELGMNKGTEWPEGSEGEEMAEAELTVKGRGSRFKFVASTFSKLPPPAQKLAVGVVGVSGVAGGVGFAGYYKRRRETQERERMEQFKLIMGEEEETTKRSGGAEEEWMDLMGETDSSNTSVSASTSTSSSPPPSTLAEVIPSEPDKKSFISIRSRSKKSSTRETSITALIGSPNTPKTPREDFSGALTSYLTFGAPGRFKDLEASLGTPSSSSFDFPSARSSLIALKASAGMSDPASAEAFASVVNCMIITIVDLAATTLKGKDPSMVVKGCEVVLDFMDHAGKLYEAVAGEAVIEPVVYEGGTGGKKLEQMYKKYVGEKGMMMDEEAQERVDKLQAVLGIKDGKAEGIQQKVMMKKMMKMMKGMKNGGDDPEAMAKMMKEMGMDMDAEGMEGMADMMKGMGGMGGLGGMGGMGDGPPSQEELKESIKMMKELIDNKMVSEEELKQVKAEFRKSMGTDIEELIKMAEEQERSGDLDGDGKELLDLFKQVLD
ncbi:hypothetical protein TrRE_jg3644 [Triparma retinervis]|uniref:Uncharacterized protein n=1 Tax=Triparma retinervis TaxID=2557542 RepID=A0A9W6ZDW6_9STRA|nr:hypothetical protein TrRE_jg3644 [Triparma retinervis]